MADAIGPRVDDEVRRRLCRRYGPDAIAWLDGLSDRLAGIAEQWQLKLGDFIRRGTVSVVLTCTRAGGSPGVLKVSPDRRRIAVESQVLAAWRTTRVPQVIACDEQQGALLLEAIRPGTALDETMHVLDIKTLAGLLDALHGHGSPAVEVPPLGRRIAALYGSGEVNYARRPDLRDLVPLALYERGRRAAEALARNPADRTVLHGDLTPANVLDGGPGRGLVAIDPAPCWGDAAFDAVDLLMWQADDLDTLGRRASGLDHLLGLSPGRAFDWCAAFAAMAALEIAEAERQRAQASPRLAMLLDLARTA